MESEGNSKIYDSFSDESKSLLLLMAMDIKENIILKFFNYLGQFEDEFKSTLVYKFEEMKKLLGIEDHKKIIDFVKNYDFKRYKIITTSLEDKPPKTRKQRQRIRPRKEPLSLVSDEDTVLIDQVRFNSYDSKILLYVGAGLRFDQIATIFVKTPKKIRAHVDEVIKVKLKNEANITATNWEDLRNLIIQLYPERVDQIIREKKGIRIGNLVFYDSRKDEILLLGAGYSQVVISQISGSSYGSIRTFFSKILYPEARRLNIKNLKEYIRTEFEQEIELLEERLRQSDNQRKEVTRSR